MRIVEVPNKVVAFPAASDVVGHHKATVEDEANGKFYAYIEQWRAPWVASGAPMMGFGVWEITSGRIDFSRVSDALSEVVAVVEKAGMRRRS